MWRFVNEINGLIRFVILSSLIIMNGFSESLAQTLSLIDTPGKKVEFITTIVQGFGGRVDWSAANNTISFDREDQNGYYSVWVMNPDGTAQQCISCNNPGIPQLHNGNPAWHPSGNLLVFQSQDPELEGSLAFKLIKKLQKLYSNPGSGINNNLWITTNNGKEFWQLTHIENTMGVLHPHFSPDGAKLVWSERVGKSLKLWGAWVIKIAEVSLDNGVPKIGTISLYTMGNKPAFYETHGFSPDGSKIIFSTDYDLSLLDGLDIYALDLNTRRLQRLTYTPDQWDEHAQFSPDGKKIAWISSMDVERTVRKHTYGFKTELWIMDADGSNKKRLTYFNDPTAPEYIAGGVAVADNSWSPDGRCIVAYLISRGQKGRSEDSIVLIKLGNAIN